ncbi:unnamed protein product, partial [Mesorhabditis belari]|uniref:Major facilitator superfamily (MFS) profile domain-containing protein n=1 Tax=Mesorhabditis belari TaxID=2138241 RepID=A0AAF3F7A3_9BILA
MVQLNVVATAHSGTADKPLHRPKLGVFVYLLSFTAVIGGFLFGYDTGIVSSAMLYVPSNTGMKPLSYVWQEIIVSVTPGFAAVGSLLSGAGSDRYGRKKVIIGSSLVFTIGALICAIAVEKIMLTGGRVLLGMAIGFASMVVPVYVGEASPAYIRGTLITGFQLMVTFGLFAANVFAGAFSYIDPTNIGWRLMFGFAAIPAGIQFVAFFCLPESPRWLYEHNMIDDARLVLDKIYNGDKSWIEYELSELAVATELAKVQKSEDDESILIRVFSTPHVRKALLIGCVLQGFQQLSGINTIMYYTGKIIQAAGVGDKHATIWISAAISVIGVGITLFAMGGAFYAINRDSDPVINNYTTRSVNHIEVCKAYRNCDYCVTDEQCGFCKGKAHDSGYCVPYSMDTEDRALVGFCMNGTEQGEGAQYEWSASFCHSRFTYIPIILMVIYLSFFSIGYAPLPWVLNAEFYPLWARSTCVSIATASNWAFNLLISLTFLSLSEALTKYGTFWLYGGITIVALVFVWWAIPKQKTVRLMKLNGYSCQKKRK